jgi:hypothetical protein
VNTNSSSPNYNKLERMGKGLVWNGVTATPTATPIPNPTPTPYPAMQFLPMTISVTWPITTNSSSTDSAYELIGPYVFRFEYYYLLTDGTLSITPWVTGHSSVAGMRDVAAIVVTIAVIDPQSRVLLSDSTNPPQIAKVAGTLVDFSTGSSHGPGWLVSQWQSVLNNPTDGTVKAMPRPAFSAIRIYERYFYLNGQTQ